MFIEVKTGMKIKDLKKQFNAYYPNLKIELFALGSEHNKSNVLDNEIEINSLKGINEAIVEFSGNSTVGNFEQLFKTQVGLAIQVFRKSGNVYLETSNTDDWTLDQEHKEALTSQVKTQSGAADFTDRDQWE